MVRSHAHFVDPQLRQLVRVNLVDRRCETDDALLLHGNR